MNATQTPKNSWKEDFLELLRFVLIVLVIVIPLRIFVAQPFIVNGESMLPTFENGDYLIVDEISYLTGTEVKRGEVIVFKYPTNDKRFLIKRVVGLPGETVSLNGSKVSISKDDQNIQLEEDYLNGNFSSYGTWVLQEDQYFVMGDNRQASSDSRSWGVLERDLIVGKTFLRLFPLSGITLHPGQREPSQIELIL